MRIVVHGDNGDYPEDVTALAEMVDELANSLDGPGDVKVTVQQSIAVREAEALATAIERLEALGVPANARTYVDDENKRPSYARYWVVSEQRDRRGLRSDTRDTDDEELDHAVAWLPSGSFLIDKTEGPYNPYITIEHLRTLEAK